MSQSSFVHQTAVTFPELANLSLEELQLLNTNIDVQDEFVNDLPQIKEQNKQLDDLILQVEELAGDFFNFFRVNNSFVYLCIFFSEANVSKQDKLEELRNNIDSRIEFVTKLAFENERLHGIYQNFSDKFSPRNIKVNVFFFLLNIVKLDKFELVMFL